MPSAVELAALERQPVAAAPAELARRRRRARSRPPRRARSRRARSRAPASPAPASLVSKAGQQPPSSATPCSVPALGQERAGGAIDLGRPVERLGEASPRPGQTTMKSWTSTRRPACAPPPKIWISGSGSSVAAGRRRDAATAARRRAAAAACAAAIETAIVALPPRRDLSGVPSSSIRRASSAAWSAASMPGQRRRDLAVHVATARVHVVAAEGRAAVAQVDAPRRVPVEAPAGAMARPIAPPASCTSASTVGRPRVSQTRRPRRTCAIAVSAHTSELHGPRPRARRASRSRPAASRSAPRHAPDALLVAPRRSRTRPATCRRPGPGTAPGSRRGRARFERVPAAPSRRRRDRPATSASKQPRKPARRGRRPQALQQQVVEAEGEVEGRVAVPGAFGVEEHRPVRPDQDVLRADVAMHQGRAWCVAVRRDQRVAAAAPGPGAPAPWRADRARAGCRGRSRRSGSRAAIVGRAGGRGVDPRRAAGRPPRRRPDRPRRRAAAPSTARWSRRQVCHGERARRRVLAQQRAAPRPARPRPRPASSAPRSRCARPARASPPRPASWASARLTQTGPRPAVDPPDVRRHAAGQRLAGQRRGTGQSQLAQRLHKGVGQRRHDAS